MRRFLQIFEILMPLSSCYILECLVPALDESGHLEVRTEGVVDTEGFVIPSLGIEDSDQDKPHVLDIESSDSASKVS